MTSVISRLGTGLEFLMESKLMFLTIIFNPSFQIKIFIIFVISTSMRKL